MTKFERKFDGFEMEDPPTEDDVKNVSPIHRGAKWYQIAALLGMLRNKKKNPNKFPRKDYREHRKRRQQMAKASRKINRRK